MRRYLFAVLASSGCADRPAAPIEFKFDSGVLSIGPDCGEPTREPPRALDDSPPASEGPQGFVDLSIEMPWSLYCVSIDIETADGRLLLHIENVCTNTFGTLNGFIGFIATCSPDGPQEPGTNRAVIAVDRVCNSEGKVLDVQPPCGDGCAQEFTCVSDRDTAVSFSLPRPTP